MNTNNEIVTMTPDEFAAKFAPAATPDSYFIRNRETGKLELHFDKADYDDLTDDQKREINWIWLAVNTGQPIPGCITVEAIRCVLRERGEDGSGYHNT